MKHANRSEMVHSRGPWAQPVKVLACPCSDGRRRVARITGTADTFFTIPAAVQVRGRTVTGFVTGAPDYQEGVREGLIFQANTFGKNGALLPRDYTPEIARSF